MICISYFYINRYGEEGLTNPQYANKPTGPPNLRSGTEFDPFNDVPSPISVLHVGHKSVIYNNPSNNI